MATCGITGQVRECKRCHLLQGTQLAPSQPPAGPPPVSGANLAQWTSIHASALAPVERRCVDARLASGATRTYSSHPERMPQGCRGGCGLSAAGCAKATARTEVGAHALMLGVARRQRHHPIKTATHCCFAVKFRLRHGQRLRGLQQPLQHPRANASCLGQDGRARLRHDVLQGLLELGGGDYLGRYLVVPAPCRPCARATAASRIEITRAQLTNACVPG